MADLEFHVFLPQMRMDMDAMVERARNAEASGFTGIALMDHLAPPMALDQPMTDAMVTATWLAAHTDTLTIGHLVLCDAFRHPAVLARQAVSLDRASGGRFELGIGWGSVPDEFDTFGVGSTEPKHRVARLAETLAVVEALWSGEVVNFEGDHHHLVDAQQLPTPIGRIPIVIGGAGPKTIALVEKHATWWNCPIHRIDRFDELRDKVGDARPSLQEMVCLVPSEAERAATTAKAEARFGMMGAGLVIGSAEELVEHFGRRAEAGVERSYVWFTDFAAPDTLAAFGRDVIEALA